MPVFRPAARISVPWQAYSLRLGEVGGSGKVMPFEILYWHWIVFGVVLILSEIALTTFFILWFILFWLHK